MVDDGRRARQRAIDRAALHAVTRVLNGLLVGAFCHRDAKILTIYEGTTAIQANDLVGRKTVRDGGAVARAILAQIRVTEGQLGVLIDAGYADDFKPILTGLQT